MIEMIIESIRLNPQNNQRVVIVKEKKGERCLPIWIGKVEADAIAVTLQSEGLLRPRAHDLMYSIICSLNASVDYVVLNDIKEETIFARIELNIKGKDIEIDSRPGDAIALAVKAGAPIFAAKSVLDRSGIILEKVMGELNSQKKEGEKFSQQKLRPEELKGLSAFNDFVNKLDMDDLGKDDS